MATVFIPVQLRTLTAGAAQVDVQAATVQEAIDALEMQFHGLRERLCQGDSLTPGLQVSIDHVMSPRGLRAKLKPNSELHFLPAIGGG